MNLFTPFLIKKGKLVKNIWYWRVSTYRTRKMNVYVFNHLYVHIRESPYLRMSRINVSWAFKYAAKISATLKYWANWKFDTRSATLKYGLSEAKIWHTFGDAQIWHRMENMTATLKYWVKWKFDTRSATLKYDIACQIWQRLPNMTTLAKYDNAAWSEDVLKYL